MHPVLWTDFEVGVNCRYGLAENDGIRVRYDLDILTANILITFQIYSRNMKSDFSGSDLGYLKIFRSLIIPTLSEKSAFGNRQKYIPWKVLLIL